MSTSIRIKDDVYSRLEANAKGFEPVPDTINRSVDALEVLQAYQMIKRQIESSINVIESENVERERVLAVHFSEEAKKEAIDMAKDIIRDYEVKFAVESNCIRLLVSKSKTGNSEDISEIFQPNIDP